MGFVASGRVPGHSASKERCDSSPAESHRLPEGFLQCGAASRDSLVLPRQSNPIRSWAEEGPFLELATLHWSPHRQN